MEFPICESVSNFNKSRWKVKPLSEEYGNFIEAIQPFNEPKLTEELKALNINRNLRILNDWARKDRHRSLHLARSWAADRNPLLRLPSGVELEWLQLGLNDHLEDNPQIALFKVGQ